MSEGTKTNNKDENNLHKKPPTSKSGKRMFKGGPMNIIKVALYMLRKKGGKSNKEMSPSLPPSTNTTLTTFVGACRPLHLQGDVVGTSPPPPPPPPSRMLPPPNGGSVTEVMASSSSSSSRSSSSGGGLSRYASVESLNNLDDNEEEEMTDDDADAYYDGLEGDEMIDFKAEMFIAKFYQQIRREQLK